MSKSEQWYRTHLCQGAVTDCPCLYIHHGRDGEVKAAFPGRKLEKYRVYCTADGKLRTICANLASWTGLTPKWCELRKRAESQAQGLDPSTRLDGLAQDNRDGDRDGEEVGDHG